MQVSVIIVDDCPIIREGLKLLLTKHEYIKVAAEVNNIAELSDELKNNIPDVIFINLVNKPVEIMKEIRVLNRKNPGLSCILLTSHATNHFVLDYIEQGVHGILNIDSNTEEMHSAILSVAAGEPFISLPLSRIKSKIIQHAHNENTNQINFNDLTDREQEVLKLFAEGLTYKEIGDKLFISPRTVETHKNNILNKLEMKSVVEMIKYAIKHELINL
jgi:DNA-binding NarL/FixJ family response regulator